MTRSKDYTTQMIWQLGCRARFAAPTSNWNLDGSQYASRHASYVADERS